MTFNSTFLGVRQSDGVQLPPEHHFRLTRSPALLLDILFWLVILGLILTVWAAWVEPRMVYTRRFAVKLAGLKHPLTAVVIGDIQPNNYHWPADRLTTLFARLQREERPDLVLWLGDYYNAPTDLMKVVLDDRPETRDWLAERMPGMAEIATSMRELRGRLGDYAVLGNHDWAWSGSQTEEALREVGIAVLKDEVATTRDDETSQIVHIVGYEDVSSGRNPDFDRLHSKVPTGGAVIALAHSPDTFKLAGSKAPSLMLSGHTHGGQIRLPLMGPLVLPLNHTRYDRGWFGDGERRLLVVTGLGTSLPPIRFMCPPEVVVLELEPEDGSDG